MTLTPQAERVAQLVAAATGLQLEVVRAWVAHESAWGRKPSGAFNFLNLRGRGGGFREFSSPDQAAEAFIDQLKRAPQWYGGILASVGRSAEAQIAAIAASPWDAGHYGGSGGPNLQRTYRSLTGSQGSSPAGLEPSFGEKLLAFIAAAPAKIGITSGRRSTERQKQLWDAAVAKYGSPEAARKWVAPPGRSKHEQGLAADLSFASPQARAWAHANASKFGLTFPLGNEPWHIEPIGARAPGASAPPADTDERDDSWYLKLADRLGERLNPFHGLDFVETIQEFALGGSLAVVGIGITLAAFWMMFGRQVGDAAAAAAKAVV